MSKNFYLFVFLTIFGISASSCAPNRQPIAPDTIPSAKKPNQSDEQYGHQVLETLSKKYELDYNDKRYFKLKEIVKNLSRAADAEKNPWHVYLFKSPEIKNAAATRGNHIFVWSGMLDFTNSDAELSAILGHEIAHILSGHTDPDPNEEIKKILINIGAIAAGIAVSASTSNAQVGVDVGKITAGLTQEIGNGAFIYPYSRKLELEADQVGLTLMAEAGYNPEEAITFWTRAKSNPDFSKSGLFFSTHPLAADRLDRLKALLPKAKERFYRAKSQSNDKQKTKSTKQKELISYQVVANKAILYKKPDIKSKALGEFKNGATVTGAIEKSNWIKVENPEVGFLEKHNLLPN